MEGVRDDNERVEEEEEISGSGCRRVGRVSVARTGGCVSLVYKNGCGSVVPSCPGAWGGGARGGLEGGAW